jgi:hypothetical protein
MQVQTAMNSRPASKVKVKDHIPMHDARTKQAGSIRHSNVASIQAVLCLTLEMLQPSKIMIER